MCRGGSAMMATLVIRNVDDSLHARLKQNAAARAIG